MNKIVILAILLFLSSCGVSPRVKEEFKGRDLNELSAITCSKTTKIESVDGDTSYQYYFDGGLFSKGCAILLEPGIHQITYRYYSGGGNFRAYSEPRTEKISMKAGKIYKVRVKALKKFRWRGTVEVLSGDEERKDIAYLKKIMEH